jgi:hypothetical protein
VIAPADHGQRCDKQFLLHDVSSWTLLWNQRDKTFHRPIAVRA